MLAYNTYTYDRRVNCRAEPLGYLGGTVDMICLGSPPVADTNYTAVDFLIHQQEELLSGQI